MTSALIAILFLVSFPGLSFAGPNVDILVLCSDKPKLHSERSTELAQLMDEDQSDYRREIDEHPERALDLEKLIKMAENDLRRRKRVSEIFAEGCILSSSDYGQAAMVFQHGNAPDHFYQAFIWAKSAVELGDESQRHLVALSADRYLVKKGYRQLFGSQFDKPGENACLCMEPVEPKFSNSDRKKFQKNTLSDQMQWLKHQNRSKKCEEKPCPGKLRSAPRGILPGIW